MRILDPIHKYIYFSSGESKIVDSALFQRLRYIRQLGFAEMAFPGAVHNRFLHSLGVCHLATRAFDYMFSDNLLIKPNKKKEFRQLLRLVALLHDIGHGPVSHLSEPIMPFLSELTIPHFFQKNTDSKTKSLHEHYSIKFILESELKDLIHDLGVDPVYVAHLIDDRVQIKSTDFFMSEGVNFKPVLKQLISSDLDMDRMDYLQRDSYFCGVDFGFCDHEWILNNLKIHFQDGKAFLAINQKAIYSVESFFVGRRHMNLTVYFHNKMVAMDEMLYQYFNSSDCQFHIPIEWTNYLHCTDNALFECLKVDSQTNEWARRIIEHKPYEKAFEMYYPYLDQEKSNEHLQKIKNYLEEKGMYFIHTNSLDHVKKLYYLSQEKFGDYPIYIVDERGKFCSTLRDRMEIFNQLSQIQLIDRIYLSPENLKHIKNDSLFLYEH